jgi:hypothetical protein
VGTCAHDGTDARFHAVQCGSRQLRYACVDASGAWFVTSAAGPPDGGPSACQGQRAGARFAVPGSGNHQQRLADAKAAVGVADVWVAYRVAGGTWSADAA